jgi:hypothetical protein
LAALSSLGACSDKKAASEEPVEKTANAAACETNSDCAQGEVCLAKACASAAPGAIYDDPANAVTVDKVKAQMDMINKQAEERMDEALEGTN